MATLATLWPFTLWCALQTTSQTEPRARVQIQSLPAPQVEDQRHAGPHKLDAPVAPWHTASQGCA